MDKRRRQYVPIAVTMPFSNTGKKLHDRFGRDGLLVWTLYLLACKANWLQGQLTYTSEPDGWSRLGLYGDEPGFTLDEFFTYTGTLKLTRRTRSGDVVDVLNTRWEDWNKTWKRERDASEKSRKRAQNTATLGATEVEVEFEYEYEVEGKQRTGPPAGAGGRPLRAVPDPLRFLTEARGVWSETGGDEQAVRVFLEGFTADPAVVDAHIRSLKDAA